MASFKKRYDAKQKKDAIKLMQEMIRLIESGTVVVQEFGTWPGLDGKLNLKVIVKEKES